MTDIARQPASELSGYDPTDPREFVDPYPSWARARREAPVFFDERLGFWQITRYDDVVATARNTRDFSSAKAGGAGYVFPENEHLLPRGLPMDTPSLANADPPEHNRVRGLCSESFRRTRISRLEPEIRQTAEGLIDKFVDKGQADLVAEFNVPFPLLVIASILGLPADHIDEMARYSDELTASFNPQLTMEQQRDLFVHYGTFYDFCEAAITNARRCADLAAEFGSLAAYAWGFEPDPAARPAVLDRDGLTRLAPSPEAVAMSKDLRRRGWAFVGPTTVHSFMQAMGLIDDHLTGCDARDRVERERASFVRPTPSSP